MTAAFVHALLDPARPVPPGLTDATGRPAGRRFSVYRNNVVAGLADAVEAGFPALRRQMGTETFRLMATAFVRAHPPGSALLMHYGSELPGFLRRSPALADRPWLADLARLELTLRESYHAADAASISPAVLATIDLERLMASSLALAPSLRMGHFDWDVLSLWHASDPIAPARGRQEIAIFRKEFDPVPHRLGPGGAPFIAALQGGCTLAAAIEAAGPGHPLSETWTLLVTHGAISAIIEPFP